MRKELKLAIESIEEIETMNLEFEGYFEDNRVGVAELHKSLGNSLDSLKVLMNKYSPMIKDNKESIPIKMQVHETYKIESDAAWELVEFMANCHKFLNSPKCK